MQMRVNKCSIEKFAGFEPRSSGVGNNPSTNWATTTALNNISYNDTSNNNTG